MRAAYPSMVFVTLILAACGGGSSSTAAPSNAQNPPNNTPTTPTQPTPDTRQRIVGYYGDSTVRGYHSGSGAQVDPTAPQAFDARLTTLGVTYPHTVLNQGVDNTDACQLLNGTDGVHPQWEQEMTASTATHVIINHGINDVLHAGNGQGDDHSMSDYRQCLTSLAQIARTHGKQVIFETPNPITAGDATPYAQAMRDIAATVGVPVIDQFAYLSAKYAGNIAATVPDGLHPRDDIYVEKGQFAAKAFQQACGNFTCTTVVVAN